MDAHAKHIEILRRMTPAQKLQALSDMYWSARQLKAAWLRKQHPDWTEEQIRLAINELFLFSHDE